MRKLIIRFSDTKHSKQHIDSFVKAIEGLVSFFNDTVLTATTEYLIIDEPRNREEMIEFLEDYLLNAECHVSEACKDCPVRERCRKMAQGDEPDEMQK